MRVMKILIIIGALEAIPKVLVKKLEDLKISVRAKTIQTTAVLRSAKSSRDRRRLAVTHSPVIEHQ